VLMTRGLFKWRAAAIGCALAILGGVAKCRNGGCHFYSASAVIAVMSAKWCVIALNLAQKTQCALSL
jgi:hypothetical protein